MPRASSVRGSTLPGPRPRVWTPGERAIDVAMGQRMRPGEGLEPEPAPRYRPEMPRASVRTVRTGHLRTSCGLSISPTSATASRRRTVIGRFMASKSVSVISGSKPESRASLRGS